MDQVTFSPHEERKIRIGYVLGTFPALTETFVLREMATLRQRGYDIRVFAIKRPPYGEVERSLIEEHGDYEVTYARPDQIGTHLIANVKALFTSPRSYLRAMAVFLSEIGRLEPRQFLRALYHFYCGVGFACEFHDSGIEHLHAHFTAACDVALAANLFCGLPFSFTAHASGDIYMKTVLLERKTKRAAFVITESEYNRRFLDSITKFMNSDKIHVVYNGIDASEPERMLRSTNSRSSSGGDSSSEEDGKTPRIVAVGSLVEMKGFATLIEACRCLKETGVSFDCEIIGEGPERVILARLIREAALGDMARLVGARSLREVYEALATADIFVHLSQIGMDGYRDGFPTVIMEAMTMSLPVVSTWVSAIPELVMQGETGFLVPERDSSAAAEALKTLIENPELRRRMGAAGRRRIAAERFDLEQTADTRAKLFLAAGRVSRGAWIL